MKTLQTKETKGWEKFPDVPNKVVLTLNSKRGNLFLKTYYWPHYLTRILSQQRGETSNTYRRPLFMTVLYESPFVILNRRVNLRHLPRVRNGLSLPPEYIPKCKRHFGTRQ